MQVAGGQEALVEDDFGLVLQQAHNRARQAIRHRTVGAHIDHAVAQLQRVFLGKTKVLQLSVDLIQRQTETHSPKDQPAAWSADASTRRQSGDWASVACSPPARMSGTIKLSSTTAIHNPNYLRNESSWLPPQWYGHHPRASWWRRTASMATCRPASRRQNIFSSFFTNDPPANPHWPKMPARLATAHEHPTAVGRASLACTLCGWDRGPPPPPVWETEWPVPSSK